MKLVIDRKKWGRGKTGGSLLDPKTGLKCCLGFYMRKKGFSKKQIRDQGLPIDAVGATPKQLRSLKLLVGKDLGCGLVATALAIDLANINDHLDIGDEEKEARITQLFGKAGVKVEFIN